jgi:DNA-binding SARP family transcriptional activator
LFLGTNFIDASKNQLYSYETYRENYSGPMVARLDLNTFEWREATSEQLTSQLHHHSAYYDSVGGRLVLYGGFGKMRYSKDFFSYDVNQQDWDTLQNFSGDFLGPRYFCSMGSLPESNSLYIFGGMGNESGEQTVGRQYYYDLYKVDLNNSRITKLWEIAWQENNMVPVRGMVMLDDSTFYTLCYPEHVSQSRLQLYRFSLKDGSYEVLGDSIPIRSDKIATNANLYYDRSLNNLYAVVQEFDDDIASRVRIYSLAFPAISAAELATYSKEKNRYVLPAIIVSSIVALAIVFWVFRRKFKASVSETRSLNNDTLVKVDAPSEALPPRANAVYLFGEFTVRDRKARDITYMFSTQLKQVFCLLLEYTTTEGGITSQRLSNILWPDKPADKVKNSRGVTINHLRKVLSELDGIELIYDKGSFRIDHSPDFYCDYMRCMQITSSGEMDRHRDELLEVISRGKFLQLFDHPLFDALKEETEKKLEPALLVEMEKSFAMERYQVTIALSEAIFNIDPLNDTALTYYLKAMTGLKMEDDARIRYKTFALEYKKVMGADYPKSFKELVN